MKFPIIIISILLTLSVFVPFYLFIYFGKKNTNSIKYKIESLLKDNSITYNSKEIWRNNFIGICYDRKILTYIQINSNATISKNIPLAETKQCNIIKSLNKDKDKVIRLKKLDLEFVYKSSSKSNLVINFYDENNDSSEDFETERVEKWHQLIKNTMPVQTITKLAS